MSREVISRAAMVLMGVAMVLAGAFGAAAQEAGGDAAKGEAIIKAVSDYYGSLETMKLRATLVQTVSVGGESQSLRAGFDFVAERPNKFSMRPAFEDQPIDTAIVSDGVTLTHLVNDDFIKRYSEQPAPATLEEITYTREFMALSGGIGEFVVPLFSDNPEGLLVDAISSFEYVGEREREGETYDVLERTTPQFTFDYYFTRGDKPRLVYVMPDLTEMMLEQRAMGATGYEASIVFSFSDFVADQPLDSEVFVLALPEGVEKVDTLLETRRAAAGFTEGERAPAFELERFAGGNVTLAQHEGKDIVILDFWATWCGPCRLAMPILDEVAENYKDKNVVLYAVNLQETPEDIKAFLADEGLDVDVLMDKTGDVNALFGVASWPTTIIIDKQGVLRKVQAGYSPVMKREIPEFLNKLLAE